jgi:hypothetical protein
MRREHYRHVAGGLIFGNPHPSLTNRGRLTVMALRTRSAGSLPEAKHLLLLYVMFQRVDVAEAPDPQHASVMKTAACIAFIAVCSKEHHTDRCQLQRHV